MKILHLFNNYLPKTQTWAFNLLRYTPSTKVYIGANNILPDNWEAEGLAPLSNGVFDDGRMSIDEELGFWGAF